jgi:hypothetical protein
MLNQIACALLLTLALHGCATETVLRRSDLEMIPQLTVSRYSTPEIRKHSGGGTGAGVVLGSDLGLGGIGIAWDAIAYSEGKEMRERLALPDFGQLIMNTFIARASDEIPNWPKMIVQEALVDEVLAPDRRYLLTFQVGYINVRSYGELGLSTFCAAELLGPEGGVLWRKHFGYSQSQAGRAKELEVLEANGGKLLKEEMDFAAETTVQNFIDHINGKSVP